jgi:transposase
MANQLKMVQVHTIEGLRSQGWSYRRIARELGIHRETVRNYVLRLASESQNRPNLTPGNLADLSPSGALSAPPEISKPATNSTTGSSGPKSKCEALHDVILAKLELDLTAQRIYQDLVAEQKFQGSYESVKRYVRKLGSATPLPFRRMECGPAEECQVDFGKGAWVKLANGKRKRPWLFRIVLSHSRKAYSEGVWKQTTENFIRCLENAFWAFGGVTKTIVLDNLRAAVTKADWFDPELNPKIEDFARHYGTVILPTKSYTPRHKGKVESGVGYAQDNGLRGKEFEGLQAHNEGLRTWEATIADLRIHGTIKKQVKKQYEEVERPELLPLPADRFPYFLEGHRKVHTDGHVEVDRAFYSVPPEYYRHEVWVRYDTRMIRVFDHRFAQIAAHVRVEPGRFSTQSAHIASQKISRVEKGAEYLLGRATHIGPKTALWAKAVLEERGIQGVRILNGLLSLTTRHSTVQMETACELAVSHGAYRLKMLRQLLSQPIRQENFVFMEEHPLIRKMADYQEFIKVNFRKEES